MKIKNVRVLAGVLAAGLAWASPAAAYTPVPREFFGPVDLTDTTERQVLWQTETTPCNGSDRYGPDGRRGTDDDYGNNTDCTDVATPLSCCTGAGTGTCPEGAPSLVTSEFILDPGCAVRAPDAEAEFIANLEDNDIPGLPPGTDLSNGFLADLTFEDGGATAVVTIPSELWGPITKNTVDTPGLVTLDLASVSDAVFKIDVASGDATSYAWSGMADTVLGPATLGIGLPGALPGECDGTNCHYYTAEAAAAPGASGATVWMCGTGGFLGTPRNSPTTDPGGLGTCPGIAPEPGTINRSPVLADAAYDPVEGTLFANARSVVLGLTPKAWAPLDGRLSIVDAPEPGSVPLLLASTATLAALAARRRRAG